MSLSGPVLIYERRDDRRGDLTRRMWTLKHRLLRFLGLKPRPARVELSVVRDARVKVVVIKPRPRKPMAMQARILKFPGRSPDGTSPPDRRAR
ncbi:MAG: hypothetical protein JSR45_15580 [Proteobacteria bacterium]|nr:hypothetical protein [Pseudomonadota bacterium]